MLRKIKTSLIVVLTIVGLILSVSLSNAGGLGSNYVVDGHVYVTVTKNPHNASYAWGVVDVDSDTEEDRELGFTDEVGVKMYVGYYDDEIVEFWADGKINRYYTGHGKNQKVTDKFVINGVHFSIKSESYPISQITPAVEASDCSDLDIDFIPVRVLDLQYRQSIVIEDLKIIRIQVSDSNIDWSLFEDGEITVEVTFNESCDLTYNVSDTISYFNCMTGDSCSGTPGKAFEGYRLTDYDYPIGPEAYAAKIRVTTENGINKHYIYINNADNHSDLVDTIVNLKVKLYQNGELIQAYEGDKIMTTNMK
jgi:hypothetical protein